MAHLYNVKCKGVSAINSKTSKPKAKTKARASKPSHQKMPVNAPEPEPITVGKKNKGGRPSTYRPEYDQMLLDYFDIPATREIIETHESKNGTVFQEVRTVANDLPTIEGFCKSLKISRETFYHWAGLFPSFADSHKKAQAMQQAIWQQNTMRGRYSQPFAIFFGKNVYGWKDKEDQQITGDITLNLVAKLSEADKNELIEKAAKRIRSGQPEALPAGGTADAVDIGADD